MAKRKAARAMGRKKTSAKRVARKAAPKRARKGARRRSASPARKRAAPKGRKAVARKRVAKTARKAAPKTARKAARKTAPTGARKSARPAAARQIVARKAPSLNRERRIVQDEDIVPTPPSSLDLDRSASAARSGRRELSEKFHNHTETSPAITGGDIDADWESAYSVGDEAPGGDNPTPDQDIVDDIGRALGVQYEDNEELKSEKKISDRDKKRWELDPASAEDYNEHDED
jgi:hypothetical protein